MHTRCTGSYEILQHCVNLGERAGLNEIRSGLSCRPCCDRGRSVGDTGRVEFVLLHGTTQSPAGWQRLNGALAARGHQCQSVDLTEVAADSPAVVYAEDLAEKLGVTSPVVVAHSGSGLLLPLIARTLHAIGQVFLAAWIPDGKHSLIAELDADPTGVFHEDWLGKDPTGDADVA